MTWRCCCRCRHRQQPEQTKTTTIMMMMPIRNARDHDGTSGVVLLVLPAICALDEDASFWKITCKDSLWAFWFCHHCRRGHCTGQCFLLYIKPRRRRPVWPRRWQCPAWPWCWRRKRVMQFYQPLFSIMAQICHEAWFFQTLPLQVTSLLLISNTDSSSTKRNVIMILITTRMTITWVNTYCESMLDFSTMGICHFSH
jgi:hypothetical protein